MGKKARVTDTRGLGRALHSVLGGGKLTFLSSRKRVPPKKADDT